MIRSATIVICLLAATGCATKSPEELAFETAQRDAYCKNHAEPGTATFEGCHQALDRAERQERAARVAAALGEIADQQARNRPVTTNCNRVGSSVNCTTY